MIKTNQEELAVDVQDIKFFSPVPVLQFNEDAVVKNAARKVAEFKAAHPEGIAYDISLLTALAGLLHDLGKACLAFQMRMKGKIKDSNLYRHEWVSLRLFEAFVGQDDDATWLSRLANPTPQDDASWISRLQRDGLNPKVQTPFARMSHAPLAQALGWLILTHHRLPTFPTQGEGKDSGFNGSMLNEVLKRVDAGWNKPVDNTDAKTLEQYWEFPNGLPVANEIWREKVSDLAVRLRQLCAQPGKGKWLCNPYAMHVSRMCLMLSDHYYSSLEDDSDPERIQNLVIPKSPKKLTNYANTKGKTGISNQPLVEHLVGVGVHGETVALSLPQLQSHLPHLQDRHILSMPSTDERFAWQDRSAALAKTMQVRSKRGGAFIVNMASTGSGKTLANARIMNALSDPEIGMRCAFAMGLRTLTLQTGQAFKDLLNLGDEEVAIRVGGSASRALFDFYEKQAEATGSASRQSLIEEDGHVVFKSGKLQNHPLLRRVTHEPAVLSLLAAPILVCTIDHLTPATESERGGRQIAPMLRLMSSDLVLDEPDQFDMDDLPALTRLVQWAGLMGSRVLLSSATLPPALIQGLFEAYRNGRHHFDRDHGVPVDLNNNAWVAPDVCCAWVDEFHQVQEDCAGKDEFLRKHEAFTADRVKELIKAPKRRLYKILEMNLGQDKAKHTERFAKIALDAAVTLHQDPFNHDIDQHSQKRVSFGLIRMANIKQIIEVAKAMYKNGAPDGVFVHLCVYHSQFPLLVRSRIERQIARALNRKISDAVFDVPEIRARINAHDERDQLFIVLGSPVTEVGQDHDYCWAVAEPSSECSLIQLAGRIRRHRMGVCTTTNFYVLETNLRHYQSGGGRPAFCYPGFETEEFSLDTHFMDVLMPTQDGVIDARTRIIAKPSTDLRPKRLLVDLEHYRMRKTMLVQTDTATSVPARPGMRSRSPVQSAHTALNAASCWSLPSIDALMTAVLPQQQPFRKDEKDYVDLVLRPNKDNDDYELVEMLENPQNPHGERIASVVEKLWNHRVPEKEVQGRGICPWGEINYMTALAELAKDMRMTLDDCAHRFGIVKLKRCDRGWWFHTALGYSQY